MQQTIIFIALNLIINILFCQISSIPKIEYDLLTSYKKILSNVFDSSEINLEEIEKDNQIFREKMVSYTSNYRETLTYKFDSLKKYIDIVTTDDGLLRIYSWDTWLGGTMHQFENLFQFKCGDKVCTLLITDTSEISEVPFYSDIFTLKTDKKTYYLAIGNQIFSSNDVGQLIKVFTIENNKINDNVKLIKTQSGFTNKIAVYFDFFTVMDKPERPVRLIKYDKIKKIIYIPIVLEDGKVTDRYIQYKFNGHYFEKVTKKKVN